MLWVKASGLWLADALTRDIFVPVALEPVLAGIATDAADPVSGAVVAALNREGLRPSIETTLHALLPHRIVVHTHSVRTIALAIRTDGEAAGCRPAGWAALGLGALLQARPAPDPHGGRGAGAQADGHPGPGQSRPCRRGRVGSPGTGDARQRSSAAWTARPGGQHPSRGATSRTRPPPAETSARPHAGGGAAAAALGLRGIALSRPRDLPWPGRPQLRRGRVSKLLLRPGAGALLAEGTGASADELALCLALVLERVPESARLHYLTAADEAELMNWDAELYRQALARTHGH